MAIDIADQDGGALQVAWWAEIEGTPHRMVAADGKLFVVTLEGQIYAFSGDEKAKVVTHQKPKPSFAAQDDVWTEKQQKFCRKRESNTDTL